MHNELAMKTILNGQNRNETSILFLFGDFLRHSLLPISSGQSLNGLEPNQARNDNGDNVSISSLKFLPCWKNTNFVLLAH